MINNFLERTELLLNQNKLSQLQSSNVLVVGVGGVGAYAAEMIARAGVGAITIVDNDCVSISNINRQLIALQSTVGMPKIKVLKKRLLDINPKLKIITIQKYITEDNIDEILDAAKYNYVVDAIDTLSPKVSLIKSSIEKGYKLVSSMGAGAKMDPTMVEVKDIGKTHHCALAHMLRKRLHKQGIYSGFDAVFSSEPTREGAMMLCDEPNKKSITGTISYMPAIFGCVVASVVIRGLIQER